jgi:hypothetical protein
MGFLFLCIIIAGIVWIVKVTSEVNETTSSYLNSPEAKIKEAKETKNYPFRKKRYLMTQTEYKFFGVLQEVIKGQYFIIPQVALSRIIEPQNGQPKYGTDSWYSNFNRINKKTVDFVIFDKVYLSPLLVIELDDYTHNYFTRQQRDDFLDGALKAANLNILHVKPQYNYDTSQLEQAIFSQLKAE